MGDQVLELELEDWQKMESRVSHLEDVALALTGAVHENSGKLGVVNDETFGIWAERLNYLSDLQESLDMKTLPKMGSELADMEKRLTRVEHMTGPHLLVERQDKEKRVTDLEKRCEEIEIAIEELAHE